MTHITEPIRKSALDIIRYNLDAAVCNTYITRVVYFGEYNGTHEDLRKRMEDIIHDLQMDHNGMPITGLFLVYPTCYIHLLELIDVPIMMKKLGDRVARYLPESTVFEFLLSIKSPVLKTIEEHLQIYSDVSPSAFWDDNNVWPPPCDIMPRDVFDEQGHRKISYYPNNEK
ncbi:uncharacterized protein LOC126858542 [Cataglyphis hispanica]|uniref:uncharacterized protein LOC126858542 n=1 Tax=Cataglyphis hispanica TaxID=1086592 RepID=UPI0021802EB5|nr:uncharacterized protein LOC126858542 [Cataglyphis hispanica]